ncbi:MAG TPA: putative porin [Kiritimatiellia bacterium]|nr:putative porin [Kiritimatiellia bacterium]HMO97676.1 putative porin [Kiritimatiellia bacterium]HMP95537.1 putative porin [Kiritimatiellia bacterium]
MNKFLMAALAGSMFAGAHLAIAQDGAKPNWSEKLTLKGDVRARFESIDEEGKETRNRGRVRARLGAYARVNDEIDAAIALASGDADPISTNQTLGEGFSSKDVRLDLAFIDWHPGALPGSIVLGKMNMPFIAVNDLQWDGDLNPEGAALKLNVPAGDAISLVFNGGAFYVVERGSADETMLYGAQAAIVMKDDGLNLTAGVSYFLYDNLAGFETISSATSGFGNSTDKEMDADGKVVKAMYKYDYEILELFAKIGFNVGLPVEIAGNFLQNQEVDDDDTGYMIGIKLGKLKDPGSFDFGYSYRELEKDAALGAFADSDAWGGGTDGKSHKVQLGYQIAKNTSGSITYFMSEKGLDNGKDYDRLQVDLSVKF